MFVSDGISTLGSTTYVDSITASTGQSHLDGDVLMTYFMQTLSHYPQ